jgi:uncharacterized YccA/Bax inhibitor family protein
MATANPAMNMAVYQQAGHAESMSSVMTLQGTVLKTAVLVAILVATAGYTWMQTEAGALKLAYGLLAVGGIGGFILAMITCFFPKASPFTAPIYAGLQGLFLGGISVAINQRYPGIALQAFGLTVGVLVFMLFLYGTGIVRATEKFKIGVIAATGAIFLVYLATMILGFFGVAIPYIHGSGPIGIGFSVVVVVIAALNLVLDFDFIEQGVARQAPKYMEWYGGFSLMVTLVWMYIEILRLLSKIRSNQG